MLRGASFAETDLLAFNFAGIASDIAGVAQRLAQRLVVIHERAGQTVADSAGLTGSCRHPSP